MSWVPPKTNWTAQDAVTANDLNRIEANILQLYNDTLAGKQAIYNALVDKHFPPASTSFADIVIAIEDYHSPMEGTVVEKVVASGQTINEGDYVRYKHDGTVEKFIAPQRLYKGAPADLFASSTHLLQGPQTTIVLDDSRIFHSFYRDDYRYAAQIVSIEDVRFSLAGNRVNLSGTNIRDTASCLMSSNKVVSVFENGRVLQGVVATISGMSVSLGPAQTLIPSNGTLSNYMSIQRLSESRALIAYHQNWDLKVAIIDLHVSGTLSLVGAPTVVVSFQTLYSNSMYMLPISNNVFVLFYAISNGSHYAVIIKVNQDNSITVDTPVMVSSTLRQFTRGNYVSDGRLLIGFGLYAQLLSVTENSISLLGTATEIKSGGFNRISGAVGGNSLVGAIESGFNHWVYIATALGDNTIATRWAIDEAGDELSFHTGWTAFIEPNRFVVAMNYTSTYSNELYCLIPESPRGVAWMGGGTAGETIQVMEFQGF